MSNVKDKVVIITGAGLGIGLGMARRFGKDGAKVVVAEFNTTAGEAAAAEINAAGGEAIFVQTDVTQRDQIENMVQQAVNQWGTVHVLINNAWSSKVPLARVEWYEDDAVKAAFDVSAMASLWAMQACFPYMKAQQFGRIINFCSLNGVNAHMYSLHYNMAKEAQRTLTRTAAVEWGSKGITVNAICPAAKTEALKNLQAANPAMFDPLEKAIPMQYFGDPEEDIAPVAVFLASEESRYMTGNTLFVDGGSHVNGSPWAPELPEELPT